MASITLGTFRDYLKAVADWANGLKEPKVQISGSKSTSATTLFNALSTPGTSTSSWVACGGYNRALVLIQATSNFAGYIKVEGRADSDVVTVPLYVFNTGLAMPRVGMPGYYEADVNPLTDLRALAYVEAGAVTVRLWLSATFFVPDTPGAELVLFNALAIRDTTVKRSPILSGTSFRRARMYVHNTHDQAVQLTLVGASGTWLRKPDGSPHQISIPANRQDAIYEASDWSILAGPLPDQVRIDAVCATAPTAGALTVKLIPESM